MAYQKIPFTPDYGGVTADDMNHIQTQYDEAAADLNAHKTASPIDHPDGSVTAGKLADGAVDTLNRIASGIRTTAGGTEANRLAVTDANGAVGVAKALANGLYNRTIFTSSGTFTVPQNVTRVFVELIGGG